MAQLLRSRQPDPQGNLLPLGTTEGSVVISSAKDFGATFSVSIAAGTFNPATATCGVHCSSCNGVTAFVVNPNPFMCFVGQSMSFTATATFANGTTQNVTSSTRWSSSNTSVATINSSGVMSSLVPGSLNISGLLSTTNDSTVCTSPAGTSGSCTSTFTAQAPGSVMPKILMGGTDISGTTQSAVVGQQIALTGDPAPPSGSTPWTVAGTTVGGFNTAPTNGGSFPADFTQASTTFYWVTAGNPLNVTYTINGKSASATFNVAGPTNPVVLTPLGVVQISPDGQFLEFGDSGSGATPGIKFQASFTPPLGFPGSFFWVQLINKSNYTFTPAGGSCSDVLGLDNKAPFDTLSTTSDSPEVAVFSDDTDIKWDFAAQMFLLWRPGIAKDIPVPLGSVNWQFFAHAAQNTSTKTWSIQTDSTKSAGSFTKSTSYPAWTTTFLNTVPPPCAK